MPNEDQWDERYGHDEPEEELKISSRVKEALSFRSKDVGGYRLGKTLGKGSCAVVKLGTSHNGGKQAAIKILKPKTLREQKEILREIDALHKLKHPNIIRLEKVIRDNGYTCLILELGKGGELFDYVMESGKLDEDEARMLFRQILSGVQYCHANLVAHRDLKPENLLLDEHGNIKITDFGLSNVIKPGSLFSTWCGSPVYTPPEVVLRKQYDGISMDIWSLGVVLYVLVTGGMPWRLESNVVKNIDDLIAGNYEIPDFLRVSEDCKDLIGKMLIADSSKRATLDAIMNHKWTCAGYKGPPDAHLEPKPLVDKIEEEVLVQLGSLGYDLAKARKSIKTDPTSPALTAYSILLGKLKRAQAISNMSSADASAVSLPAEFLKSTRVRSVTHPVPQPKSKSLSPRKDVSSVGAKAQSPVKEKEKEKWSLRSLFDRFRKGPTAHIHMKENPAISIVMAHNSPTSSPPLQRI